MKSLIVVLFVLIQVSNNQSCNSTGSTSTNSTSNPSSTNSNDSSAYEVIIPKNKMGWILHNDVYDYHTKTLVIGDSVTFIANDTEMNGKPRNVIFRAQSIIFKGTVYFIGNGENGNNGAGGANCTNCDVPNSGVSLYSDRSAYDEDCRQLGQDTRQKGQAGSRGGNGIQGTCIVFEYNNKITGFDTTRFHNNLKGGQKGIGGQGGFNKKDVFDNNGDRTECNPLGDRAPRGGDGSNGVNGTITSDQLLPQ